MLGVQSVTGIVHNPSVLYPSDDRTGLLYTVSQYVRSTSISRQEGVHMYIHKKHMQTHMALLKKKICMIYICINIYMER